MSGRASGRLFRAAVCVALGVLTTVLLAWVLAVTVVVNLVGVPGQIRAAGLGMLADGSEWQCQVLKRPGLTVVTWNRDLGRRLAMSVSPGGQPLSEIGPGGATWLRVRPIDPGAVPSWARPPPELSAATATPGATGACSARGWPFRALWYEATFNNPSQRVNRGGIPVPAFLEQFGQGPVLPYRLLPLGFALDAALWAGAWWALLALAGYVAAAMRRREGHCSSCGYDLRGTAHACCPECGAA